MDRVLRSRRKTLGADKSSQSDENSIGRQLAGAQQEPSDSNLIGISRRQEEPSDNNLIGIPEEPERRRSRKAKEEPERIAADRLTMLDEPSRMRPAGRETLLGGAEDRAADSSSRDNRAEQSLLLAGGVLALLVGLAILVWFRRRRRRKRADSSLLTPRASYLNPSTRRRRQQRQTDADEADEAGEAGGKGESFRLEERRESGDGPRRLGSMVTFKRRLARGSTVIASRCSGAPKVRLIRARVRKFIDEEAAELEAKRRENAEHRKRGFTLINLFAFLLEVLKRAGGGEEAAAPVERVGSAKELRVQVEERAELSECGQASGWPARADCEEAAPEEAARTPRSDRLCPRPAEHCSSLSACSLFSASPVMADAGSLAYPQAPCAHCLGPREACPPAERSKSQGHTPCQLGACPRACCSQSSMAAGQSEPSCWHGAGLESAWRHQANLEHRLRLMAAQMAGQYPSHLGANCAGQLNQGAAKCNQLIKRQYENYYDDEREDAYRRLTASIGVHFGLLEQPALGCQPDLSGCYPQQACQSVVANQLQLSQLCPQTQVCKCCQLSKAELAKLPSKSPFHEQISSSHLFAGCSSEPLSLASLNNSDSGLGHYFKQLAVCNNPLCACQPQPSQVNQAGQVSQVNQAGQVSQAPMSILVQQPSMATPPPEPATPSEPSAEPEPELGPKAKAAKAKFRHRHRRHLSQRLAAHCAPGAAPFGANRRRMSIAGDHLSGLIAANYGANCKRASVASDGGWGGPQPIRAAEASAGSSHRPSDASLYEPNNKSNCSSSGGSSSGIGVTGSACTNTPTSSVPYGYNFETTGRHLYQAPLEHDQSLANCYGLQTYLAQHATGSRKFSLPAQLESQPASERVSPGSRSRLLFERNLQLVDSARARDQSSASTRTHGQVQEAPMSFVAQSLEGQRQVRQRPSADSRRSSQTITRQSSFWLEDNSIDSVLSLTTTTTASNLMGLQSEEGSQVNVNQLESEPSGSQVNNKSARASIASLILSADSIESVKKRPEAQSVLQKPAGGERDDFASASGSANDLFVGKAGPSRERRANRKSVAQLKKRLSWSSSSSTTNSSCNTSSPSPDFSRPSERILALTSKSASSISKRHHFSRLRAKRCGRGADCNKRPANQAPQSSSYRRHKDETDDELKSAERSSDSCETSSSEVNAQAISLNSGDPLAGDRPPMERPTAQTNSASM